MKKRLAKTLFMLLPCIIMALSSGACGVEPRGFFRTLNHSGISVELRLKGIDESSAAEDMVTAMSRYDYALFSSSGSVSRFNAAEGDIFEGETNVLGEKDKYVRVSADNYLYSAVMRAKQLYRMTDGAFNIATKRLRERWRSNVAPSDALILRDIAGVQNPLLITERIIDGKYYLEKDVNFYDDGKLYEEHTYITFEDAGEGIMCDAAVRMASGKRLTSAEIRAGSTRAYLGSGEMTAKINLSTGEELADVTISGGQFVSIADVYKNSYALATGSIAGGIINPRTGIPTTLEKVSDGVYTGAGEYVFAAIVVSDSGIKTNALCVAACVDGKLACDTIAENGASALIFMSDGKVYVVGDMRYELAFGEDKYEIIRV